METAHLRTKPDAIAPDGSDVRVLVRCGGGSLGHFELAANETSVAVAHRTLDEMWFFISGRGKMWRKLETSVDLGRPVEVSAGVALTIPNHTHFQFRSTGTEPLAAIGVTMPPWPGIGDMSGKGECYFVDGPWTATVQSGMDE